ncbi:unnamed protein product, partial [Prorocentrum cordatum]
SISAPRGAGAGPGAPPATGPWRRRCRSRRPRGPPARTAAKTPGEASRGRPPGGGGAARWGRRCWGALRPRLSGGPVGQAFAESPPRPPRAAPGGTRRSVGLGLASAALGLPALTEEAWAAYENPWPYDVSRGKIAKKLAPFTGKGCPADSLMTVTMGPSGEGLKFVPETLNMVQGCYYELALNNPSALEHNFVALEFAKSVYTLVILAGAPPAEFKGQAVELELKPGASLGWFLVPVKAGSFDLRCSVKAAGWRGQISGVRLGETGAVACAPALSFIGSTDETQHSAVLLPVPFHDWQLRFQAFAVCLHSFPPSRRLEALAFVCFVGGVSCSVCLHSLGLSHSQLSPVCVNCVG